MYACNEYCNEYSIGTCIDLIGDYTCKCIPGYAGRNCEGDINECSPSPCNQEGSHDCQQLVNDFRFQHVITFNLLSF